MESVVIRKDGNYFNVPIRDLYIQEEAGNEEMDFSYPIKEVYKSGDNVTVTYQIKNVNTQIKIGLGALEHRLYTLGFTDNEKRLIIRYVTEVGLTFKTKRGFLWRVDGEVRETDKVAFRLNTARLINDRKGYMEDGVHFMNIYPNTEGRVCWGSTPNLQDMHTIEEGYKTYFRFVDSLFNCDLEKDFNQGRVLRYINSYVQGNDQGNTNLTQLQVDVKELLHKKINREGQQVLNGDLILLIIASAFEMDYMDLDDLT